MCWKSQQEMKTSQFETFSHVFYFPMYIFIDAFGVLQAGMDNSLRRLSPELGQDFSLHFLVKMVQVPLSGYHSHEIISSVVLLPTYCEKSMGKGSKENTVCVLLLVSLEALGQSRNTFRSYFAIYEIESLSAYKIKVIFP